MSYMALYFAKTENNTSEIVKPAVHKVKNQNLFLKGHLFLNKGHIFIYLYSQHNKLFIYVCRNYGLENVCQVFCT